MQFLGAEFAWKFFISHMAATWSILHNCGQLSVSKCMPKYELCFFVALRFQLYHLSFITQCLGAGNVANGCGQYN